MTTIFSNVINIDTRVGSHISRYVNRKICCPPPTSGSTGVSLLIALLCVFLKQSDHFISHRFRPN